MGTRRRWLRHAGLAAAGAGLTSCHTSAGSRIGISRIYDEPAQQSDLLRNPIIVIPGSLGSNLRDSETGQQVWGAFNRMSANPNRTEDLRRIALPMERGRSLTDLRDEILPDGALEDFSISLLPGVSVEAQAYRNLLRTLGAGGYRDEGLGLSGGVDYGEGHFTCFQFAYDWRRSIDENAVLLERFIEEKRNYVREEIRRRHGIDRKEIQFDLVGHSMGALLSRYFLRHGGTPLSQINVTEPSFRGTRYVEKALLVAPPSLGSVYAFGYLIKGVQLAPIVTPHFPAALLGTMPSAYQLLARTRHGAFVDGEGRNLDVLDPQVWEENRWGLMAPEAELVLETLLPELSPADRKNVARDHLEKCLAQAQRFHEAIDAPVGKIKGTQVSVYLGDTREVATQAAVFPGARIEYRRMEPGDGTVPRYSALADERFNRLSRKEHRLSTPTDWEGVHFVSGNHIGLTSSPEFTKSVLFHLLEE